MKTVLLASAFAAMAVVAAAPVASAAPLAHAPYQSVAPASDAPYEYVAGRFYAGPVAFPRGVSYGTGYHGAGTLTGGPSGGLPSRN